MFPTLVEMFNITGLSNVYIYIYITCGHANFITYEYNNYISMVLTLAKCVITYKISFMSEPC